MYFKYDFKIGILKNWKNFLIVILIFIIAFISTNLMFKSNQEFIGRNTILGDYFLYIFSGMKPFFKESGEDFKLPITWIIIQVSLAYLIGKYPTSELYNNHGTTVLLRGNSRSQWWFSKCLWNIITVVIFYIVSDSTIFLLAWIYKVPISFNITYSNLDSILYPITEDISINTILLSIFLLPLLTSICTSLIQMVITFLFNGVCGFLSICVMCILSAYFYNPIFIGNFSMLARQELYLYEGIKFKTAILSLITLILLSIFLGWMYFKKYDILHKERDN